MSNEFEKFIQNNREAFDDQLPDPAVLERIQHQLSSATKKQGVFIPIKVIRWAAACLLLAGAGTFMILQKEPSNNIAKTEKLTKDITPAGSVTKVQEEAGIPELVQKQPMIVHKAKQRYAVYEKPDIISRESLFAKLNDRESPGQRIMGAEQANQLQNTDIEIIDVLMKTMNSDSNTNVRLAALEALSQFYRVGYVKQQLIASLKEQKDPMIQIGLIQLLTGMKETSILNILEEIANDDSELKEVRDQAYSSIFILKS